MIVKTTMCKITVLKCLAFEDLVKEYMPEGFRAMTCHILKPGDVFYTKGFEKPDGFCGPAWDAIGKKCAIHANGGTNYKPFPDIVCCNDGLRPVIFKLEAEEVEIEESKLRP